MDNTKMHSQKHSRAQDWLKDFLQSRDLNDADGRHLFAYHINPSEFNDLKDFLQKKVQTAADCTNSILRHWGDNNGFCALFVLYASHWWQQHYSGGMFEWKPIMESLAFPEGSWEVGQLGGPVTLGLRGWHLEPRASGHKYLGSIAREAGLPLKLLSEHRGKVGLILKQVLREALRSGQHGNIVYIWVASMKTQLPVSYQDDTVISLLADSINIIIDIKNHIKVEKAEEALAELDIHDPHWKERFPLPLHDAAARELLNQLLRDAATHENSKTQQTGNPVQAERRLRKTLSGIWEIETSILIPERITISNSDEYGRKWRSLLLNIQCGLEFRECILRKHAQYDYYNSSIININPFVGREATSEVKLHLTTTSGIRHNTACIGGQELDDDLPWIFEAHEPENIFRQQGGGSVRSSSMFVALAPEWQIFPHGDATLVEEGPLSDLPRTLYRLSGRGEVCKGSVKFPLRTGQLDSGVSYGWQGLRYWEYVTSPSMAFRGLPHPVKQTTISTTELRNVKLMWKQAHQTDYKLAHDKICGIGSAWYRDPGGQALRSTMLVLPLNACLRFETHNACSGTVILENWQIERISLEQGQQGLLCHYDMIGDSLRATITTETGKSPPEQVHLCVYWSDCPVPARISIPFPAKGARLFDKDGNEVSWDRKLCVSDLFGMRLQCMAGASTNVCFEFNISIGAYNRSFPIDSGQSSHFFIRLQDWQNEILEAMSTATELDAYVTMRVLADQKELARWEIARYSHKLIRDEGAVYLETEELSDGVKNSIHLAALCLTAPHLGPQQLKGTTNSEKNVLHWSLTGCLPYNGPWLIYDATPHTSIRPVLWHVFDEQGPSFEEQDNELKMALASSSEERESRLQECIDLMCNAPSAPEWATFSGLTKHLSHLPLSTLDVWKVLSRNSRAMAIIAFRPDIELCGLTDRASSELPFLWLSVSREEWKNASEHLYRWCVDSAGEENSSILHEMLLKNRREGLSAYYPIINSILHIACHLPEDEKELQRLDYFKTKNAIDSLYGTFKNELFTRCADLSWPENFRGHVKNWRRTPLLRDFLPSSEGYRDSIVCLPIAIALQVYTGENVLSNSENTSTEAISAIRQHISFDFDWFDLAFMYTIYRCYAQDM